MYINPTRFSGPPEERRSEPENAIYEALAELNIPFDRVDHEYADTMEDCVQIEKLLEGKICKNLFLCNRQQTEFYLLMMPSGKPFKTKYLSAQLGCSRLSFAGESFMEDLLNTIPGSVSALELIFDREGKVRLLFDRALLEDETICAHPGRSTSTLRIAREDFMRYVNYYKHSPTFIDLPDQPE
ncbi:MAG: prolyl-tRNA synthetase associated domain-containing protein [Oscillospiraceae bacterium]|nr:prolyl-tRNA synthetase associated domain-containing protein [Oscillospiraceae bacterium]